MNKYTLALTQNADFNYVTPGIFEKDVHGFEVTMHNTLLMDIGQALQHLL